MGCWRAQASGLCSWIGEPGSLVGTFATVALAAWRRDDHANRTRWHHSRYRRARFAGRAVDACSAQLAVAAGGR
jgi:hypothetical protein